MRVVRFHNLDECQSAAASQWNSLAQGVPFRRWQWASSWWRHYGQDHGRPLRNRELYVLAVSDDAGTLLGLAPWHLQHTASQGRTVRMLGSGEVCSEYLGLLCRSGSEEAVAGALAQWLTEHTAGDDHWDTLKLAPLESGDLAMGRLSQQLAERGHSVCHQPAANCWRLALPATWEEYLADRSKSHRKQLRRLERAYFRSGRARMQWVHDPSHLAGALERLIDLHQRHWRARGQAGCFNRARFEAFHREVAPRLMAADCLQLGWLELDGRSVAAEYHFTDGGIVYAYQSGVAPYLRAHQPGHLANLATIRRAIDRGDRAVDFLRGDEPYKAHWGAVSRPMVECRVVSTRLGARVRQGLWTAGGSMVGWLKGGWQFAESLLGE